MITLTWCVWVRRNPEAAFTWAWAPAVALQGVPAVLVATNVLPLDPTGLFWIWPGYFGVTTVGALVLAYVMAGRR